MSRDDGWSQARAVRAAVVALIVVSGFWAAYYGLLSASACGTSADPFGCMGFGLLLLAVGSPIALGLIAWGLRGKGVIHGLVGAILCAVAGFNLAHAVVARVDSIGSEVVGLAVSAVTVAALVALWAELGPDTRSRRGR